MDIKMNKENIKDLVDYILETEWDSFEEYLSEELSIEANSLNDNQLLKLDIAHIYTIALSLKGELNE